MAQEDTHGYVYENVGAEQNTPNEGYGYTYENAGLEAISKQEGYAYVTQNVGRELHDATEGLAYTYAAVLRDPALAADDISGTLNDAATFSWAFSSRDAHDETQALDDAASALGLRARSGSETFTTSDDANKSVTALRGGEETVPEPTDAVTYTYQRFLVREGNEVLSPPIDRVRHLTKLGFFAQPVGQQARIKRVLPTEPRSNLTKTNPWSSDVPISRPVPYNEAQPVMVDLGGFGFTTGGLVVNLSEADDEAIFTPFYAPQVSP